MTQHTPGPWRVGDAGWTVFGPPNGEPSPETIAEIRRRKNARLIAAAPELLEAAQRVTGISWAVGSLALNDSIEQLRAAIAKATG